MIKTQKNVKKITIITMLLTLSLSYSQKNPCKITKTHDDFTEITNIEGKRIKVSKGNYPVEIQLFKVILKSGEQSYGMVVSGSVSACVTRKSQVIFILKNGEKIYLKKISDSINCGVSYIMVSLSVDDIEKLCSDLADKGRLDYDDDQEDFIFSEKGQKEFIDNLKCIK